MLSHLPLTPEVLKATYEFLNVTEPFCRWNLPDGDDTIFKINRSKTMCGWHDDGDLRLRKPKVIVSLSSHFLKTNRALVETMSHEMCHIHQFRHFRHEGEHGPAFQRLADQVCRAHGFDRGLF